MARFRLLTGLLAGLTLVGCAMDSEEALRAHLSQRFLLAETLHFASKPRCTGAVFRLQTDRMLGDLEVVEDIDMADAMFIARGISAIRTETERPHDLTDALLKVNYGAFGKTALSAVALSQDCFEGDLAQRLAREAFLREGATLIVSGAAVLVLDAPRMRLIYAAGSVR